MGMNKNIVYAVGMLVLLSLFSSVSASPKVRIKDIAKVMDARENQLMGFGLVVGLKNTGDSAQTEFTKMALSNLLNNMDVTNVTEANFKSRNAAAVMITTDLPAFLKPGQRIDVVVSSLGDAKSLSGGTLLLSPLKGADGAVYAVAQGGLLVGGLNESLGDNSYAKNQPTVGRIPYGAIVEKEVAVDLASRSTLNVLLNTPDFTNASRVAYAINISGLAHASAKDATTIEIEMDARNQNDVVGFIAKIEELSIYTDSIAKVVVSERTGTIVIGDNVKLDTVAVTHGQINVKIVNNELLNKSEIKIYEKPSKLVTVARGTNLASLVKALNAVGASPRDLISILQAIKKAGALTAELEII